MHSDREIVLSSGAVARALGVAVPTLRSWDRRYGLGASARTPGGHRLYTEQDLARLRRMVALAGEGTPPAAAARLALGAEVGPGAGRHGGGSGALALGKADAAVRGLSRHATRLDVNGLRRRLTDHIVEQGVAMTWSELLVPLLRSIGEAYERTPERVVPIEHAATAASLAVLHSVEPVEERGRLPALLACAPDEQHSLPLEALRAALAERDVAARFLGARFPADALSRTADRLRPTTAVIWAHRSTLARRVPVADVADRCSQLLLAGPGWAGVRSGSRFQRALSLQEAVRLIVGAAGR